MKTLLAQLDATEIALVAGGETEGGCIDPDPVGTDVLEIVVAVATSVLEASQTISTGN